MVLHPMLVHFPIAFLLAGAALEMVGWRLEREDLRKMGLYALVAGLAAAVMAAVTGLLEEERAEDMLRNGFLVERHRNLAVLAILLFGALVYIRLKDNVKLTGQAANGYILLAVLGIAALGAAGYLGGEMVYGQAGNRAASYREMFEGNEGGMGRLQGGGRGFRGTMERGEAGMGGMERGGEFGESGEAGESGWMR